MYIYRIFSKTANLAYVGSTQLHVKTRISQHISSHKKNVSTCSSKIVLDQPDYKFETLYKVDDDAITVQQLKEMEKSFIDKTREQGFTVVNKNVPARSPLQYYYDNRQDLLQKMKDRYNNDPEHRLKINKTAQNRYTLLKEFQRLGSISV